MFATIGHGHQLHKMTQNLSSSDSQLATMQNKHGARKFWAAVKSQGLEPEDLDRNAEKDKVTVHPMVPSASAPGIAEHRTKLWDGLREQRIRDVDNALEYMKDESVRRYFKCKQGIHAVDPYKDLPPVDKLEGMDKFNQMMDAATAKEKAEQHRKAMKLGLEFLMEKKKRDDADAKVAAFEKRIADYKRAEAEKWEEAKKEGQKRADKRADLARRAAQKRADWEDETERHLWDRFNGARQRRGIAYSPDTISAKLEANKQKRMDAWRQAVKQEEELLNNLENRRINCENRLEARRQENEAYLAQRRADSQAKYQQKQVLIHARTTEWVDNKLKEDKELKQRLQDSRDRGKEFMKDRAQFTKDTRAKAWARTEKNKDKNNADTNQANDDLMARHQAASVRREELREMGLKCECDIHTHREIKHHSFGELTNRRNTEIKKRTDAQQQHLVYVLAERQAKNKFKEMSMFDLRKARQQCNKEALTLKDKSAEGFLKIQSEPDEGKVIARMNAMGFDMPKLPQKEEDEGVEEAKPGF